MTPLLAATAVAIFAGAAIQGATGFGFALLAAPLAFAALDAQEAIGLLTPVVAWHPITFSWPVLLSLVALGALGTGVVYIWNMNVLRAWGPTITSGVTYVTPVVGVALGILVLGEHLTWNEPVGAAVVLAGILLTQQRVRVFTRRQAQLSAEGAR